MTHTDQYLQFSSHHPGLHHKLGVIRTLLDRHDRSDSIVTEVEDKEKEEENKHQALAACDYPEWIVNKVKKDRSQPKQRSPAKKQSDGERSKGLVVVPPGGGGYFHRNAIRGRAAQMGRFLTKNP